MAKGYYFETETDMTEPELGLALENAGIKAVNARRTTLNHDGVIITETLANGIWNHETGYDYCNDDCRGQVKTHTEWNQLSPEQRDTFTKRLIGFMENSRIDQFSTAESMEYDQEFANIALERCDNP